MANKRRVTVALDETLVQALEASGGVSAQLNEAAVMYVEQRHRAARLAALLDDLDHSDDPVARRS